MEKLTNQLQTVEIIRKSKIRYVRFNGENYEFIVDYIMSKNQDNDLYTEGEDYILIEIDGKRKYINKGDYVVWDVFAKKLSIMTPDEWLKFSKNFA